MKGVLPFIALLLIAWSPLRAEPVIVYTDIAQLRAQPTGKSKVIGLVFGGEVLEVQETRGGWFKVRSGNGEAGWISPAAADLARRVAGRRNEPRVHLLITGNRHQDLARVSEACLVYTELIIRFPATFESYVATRRMFNYHRIATLPEPKDGHVTRQQNDQGRKIGGQVLMSEARKLISEGRIKLAGNVLSGIGDVAGKHLGDAEGVEDLMREYVVQVAERFSSERLTEAVAMFRRYFPEGALPDEIDRRVPAEAKESPAQAPVSAPPTAED